MAAFFISAVTSEYGPWRGEIRKALQSSAAHAEIQEDFSGSVLETLDELEARIEGSDGVIHLIGNAPGVVPDERDVDAFMSARPDLVRQLRFLAKDGRRCTFTQWEAYLALYQRKELLICKSRSFMSDPNPEQRAHHDRLRSARKTNEIKFCDLNELLVEVLRTNWVTQLRAGHDRTRLNRATRLRLRENPQPVSVAQRRDALAVKANWRNLHHYWPRDQLRSNVELVFHGWFRDALAAEDKIPVFWLDGRSGDGKSVLLLQLIDRLIATSPLDVYLLDSPSALADTMRELSRHSARCLLVVDDMHRGTDAQFFEDISRLLGMEGTPPIPLLACGPSPEMKRFKDDGQNAFDVFAFPVPSPTVDELSELARWLDAPWSPSGADHDHFLVEFLFELNVGEPIRSFAISFRQRLAELDSKTYEKTYERVRTIVGLNGLGLPAPASLLEGKDGITRKVIRVLAQSDQRHFDLTRTFGDGRLAVWFAHERIAFRVFEIWTADPTISGALAESLVAELVPIVRDYHTNIDDLGALIDAVILRLPQMASNAADANPAQILSEVLHGDAVPATCRAWIAARVLLLASRDAELVDEAHLGAFATEAEALYAREDLGPRVRAHLGSLLLVRGASKNSSELAAVEQTVRRMLFASDFHMVAPSSLLTLATRDESAKRGWERWPEEWLRQYPTEPAAGPIYAWVLARAAADSEFGPKAMSWVESNPGDKANAQMLNSLLRSRCCSKAVVDQAERWLDANPRAAQSHRVVEALLGIVKTIPHRMKPPLDALELALKYHKHFDACAQGWLQGNNSATNVSRIQVTVARLQAGPHSTLVQCACPTHQDPNRESKLAAALLERVTAREAVLESALGRIAPTKSLVARDKTDAEPPRVWQQQPKLSIQTQEDSDDSTTHRLLEALLARNSLEDALQRFTPRAEREAVQERLAYARERTVSSALEWYDARTPNSGSDHVLRCLLATVGTRDEVFSRGMKRLESADERTKTQLLEDLLKAPRSLSSMGDLPERALAWLADNETHAASERIRGALLEAEARTAPADSVLAQKVLDFVTAHNTSAFVAGSVIGHWLRSGGPEGPAVTFILDHGSHRAAPIALARNVELALDIAKKLEGSERRLVCRLLRIGVTKVEGASARLLARRAGWPGTETHQLWRGIVETSELFLESQLYIEELVSVMRKLKINSAFGLWQAVAHSDAVCAKIARLLPKGSSKHLIALRNGGTGAT